MRIRAVCVSLLISMVITMLMLLATAFLMYKCGLKGIAVSISVVLIYVISNFAGGYILGKCAKSRRFLWGLLLATAYYCFYLLLAVGCGNGGVIGIGNALVTYLIIAGSGMLGGMLCMQQ